MSNVCYGLSALISLQGLKELAFFYIPFITWNFLQPVLKGYYQGQKDAFLLNRFKYHHGVFQELKSILLGLLNATRKLPF